MQCASGVAKVDSAKRQSIVLELVVAVVILLSPLVVIQYNKQKILFFVPTILLVPDNTCV